jgi:DNA-binding IclR family transcriptional regulator
MTEPEPAAERAVVTVERAVAVLVAIADAPSALGTNEIARRIGSNPSSVSRLLATLAKLEMVKRVADTGRYQLGPRLIQLGNAALDQVDLRAAAKTHLRALAQATGETATLSLPGKEGTVTVDFVYGSASVRSIAQIGRPSAPHATATGKVLLAWGEGLPKQDPGQELEPFTPHTVTDPRALAREVALVRQRGWAQAVQEREEFLNAVAVPVLGERSRLAAVLALQGPSSRFDHAAMAAAAEHLLGHAAELSASLVR